MRYLSFISTDRRYAALLPGLLTILVLVSPATATRAQSLPAQSLPAQSVSAQSLATLPTDPIAFDAALLPRPIEARLVEAIDESRLTTLQGNTHPFAHQALAHPGRPARIPTRVIDEGRVNPELPMGDLILVLRRGPVQQAAFDKLVAEQYDPQSPHYHQWLTPEQVGQEFGPVPSDLDGVSNWLRNHGFSIDELSHDHLSFRFSGTVSQVENTFHTEIHNLAFNASTPANPPSIEHHIANATDPQIPTALAPLIVGVKALHNFFPRPLHRLGGQVSLARETNAWQRVGPSATVPTRLPGLAAPTGPHPQFGVVDGYGSTIEDVAPYDFATIYNVVPLWKQTSPIDGAGQTIAIAGTSNINLADVAAFRAAFGLPAKAPSVLITNNDPGACPGFLDSCSGDLVENTLDVEWAGAVAKGASIVLVTSSAPTATSDPLYLSENYIVNHKTASIMNVSYGECEVALGNAGNAQYNNLWQTAAAEGIAVIVASGDAGSPACDQGFDAYDGVPYAAQFGPAVSGISSTPFNTAVGGTDLNWGATPAPYWSSTNSAAHANALNYIPEVPWNSTCTNPLILPSLQADAAFVGVSGVVDAESACNFVLENWQSINTNYNVNLAGLDDTIGGGGGVSLCTSSSGADPQTCSGGYAKPSWQTGVTGIPADGHRDLPDVSFFASNGFLGSSYLICVSGGGNACAYSNTTEPIAQEVGGTSVASPAMAGVMALINQKSGSSQGSPNRLLYALAAKQTYSACKTETGKASSTCVFNDIDTGTIAMPCVNGSPDCATTNGADPIGITNSYNAKTGYSPAYNAGLGYDLATGLGSLNVANVVNNWPTSTNSPVATLSPTSLTFPATTIGMAATTQTVTLKNTGKSSLTLNGTGQGITITGVNPHSFTQTNNCGSALAASASCILTITFKPAVAGSLSASVNLADNAYGSPQKVVLSGISIAAAPSANLSAQSLSFGSTVVGSTNSAPNITLTNSGTATLSISAITITGVGASSFSQTHTCAGTLAAKATCAIAITFKPIAAGNVSATLNVADNASGSPQTLALSGVGATKPAVSHRSLPPSKAQISQAQISALYGHLPLRFEANQGQAQSSVKFLSRGEGYTLTLTAQDAALTLQNNSAASPAKPDVIHMQLIGADSSSAPVGSHSLPGVSNYLIGNDPSQWHTSIPAYARVEYPAIYPGIDLVYYGNQQQLEYDFVVAAHADPTAIRLHFAGARSVDLDTSGNLVIHAPDGSIAFHKPVVYQLMNGQRQPVASSFHLLADNSTGFTLGSYDHAQPLIIDPTLVYSTFLGGSNSDTITGIAVDSSGNAYLTGYTSSTDYPVTPGALNSTYNESHSVAFVTKLNPSGTALVYSTFLGGTGGSSIGDLASSIAVDSSGQAYVTGMTGSSNFPVTKGAFQTTNKGYQNGFVSKLNATGTALTYSTYLGGTNSEVALSLAIDSSGDAFIAGGTYSKDFPVTSAAYQKTNNSFPDDGWNEFVTKLNPAGTSLLYSTLIGGSGDYGGPDRILVAIDKSGDAYVSGIALSKDFPVTSGVFQKANAAKSGYSDMTLTKFNPTGSALLYSTYLGGTGGTSFGQYGGDVAKGLAVDSAGNAYLTGTTLETDYPVTKGAFQTTSKSGGLYPDSFITKVNPTGSALVYSTYLGGSDAHQGEAGYGLSLDSSGDAFVIGATGSSDFPVTANAFQKVNNTEEGQNVFLTEINPAGNALLYSTYMGGNSGDLGYALALGGNGAVYIAGIAGEQSFPVTKGAYKTVYNSQQGSTGFVAQFAFSSVPATIATSTYLTSRENPATTGSNLTFSASVTVATGTAIPTGNVVFNIDETNVATVALDSQGYANYTTKTPLALGSHHILASYLGNSTYSASGNDITQVIALTAPVISPTGGVFPSAVLVTITQAASGATVYYTVDGSVPAASSYKYSSPILVSADKTIRAIAIVAKQPASAVVNATYTLISAPYALAVPPTAVNTSGATLHALVNPYGMVGSYSFQYGVSATALTSSTAKVALPASSFGGQLGLTPIPISAPLTGLKTTTTYYYQVVITTAAGSSSGEVLSFTTN